MQILNIQITAPANLQNNNNLPVWNNFFLPIYSNLYQQINPASTQYPHINFDTFIPYLNGLIAGLTPVEINQIRSACGISKAEWQRTPEIRGMYAFLSNFIEFANLLQNIHLLTDLSIKAAEFYQNITIDTSNFILAKQFIDQINFQRWTREQTFNEKQSGVSNLGGVSERLLEIALAGLIDDTNFFKTNNQHIQSYGDFVLMCLPNNLWLSVKSNYARERLLASGYTTDILGVGYFTDRDEFTSLSKIRNFQRVGFLAMYLPDIPVSDQQVTNGTNTYDEVVAFYNANNKPLPININGTQFLRRLSSLHNDISSLLAIADVRNRTTIGF